MRPLFLLDLPLFSELPLLLDFRARVAVLRNLFLPDDDQGAGLKNPPSRIPEPRLAEA